VFFSYFYSAKPLRFKVRPPLDSIANATIYFFGPFGLAFLENHNFLEIPVKTYWVILAIYQIHIEPRQISTAQTSRASFHALGVARSKF